ADDDELVGEDADDPFAKLNLQPRPGPAKVPLGENLTLDLPAGYVFLDKGDAHKFATALKNVPDQSLVGTILKAGADWFVEVSYDAEGYVKDDDAEKLDPDAILESYQEGT